MSSEPSSSSLCPPDADEDTLKEDVNESDISIKKQKNKIGEAIGKNNIDTSAIDKDAEEHEMVVHSPIEWASHAEASKELEKFETEMIQPHIIAEEYKSLAFVNFIDYLRVNKCSYPVE